MTKAQLDEWVSDDFQRKVDDAALSIYQQDKRGRTLEHVVNSTARGAYGELLVYHLLKTGGIEVEWNEPMKGVQRSFNFDLLAAKCVKIEVKTQNMAEGSRKFFSYSVKDEADLGKLRNFTKYWEDYDVMVVVGDENGLLSPWLVIDSMAFSPDETYFVKSKEYDSWFLKTDVAARAGLLYKV